MMAAKAAGLIERLTCGPPKGYKRKPSEIERARVVVRAMVVADAGRKPGEVGESNSDRLERLTGKSLATAEDILTRKVIRRPKKVKQADGSVEVVQPDLKLLALQGDIAMRVLSAQVRIDEGKLRVQGVDRLGELLERLEALKAVPTLVDEGLTVDAEPENDT